ncbi:MAG: MlaD family protein, partial [Desulfatirhabdiaceae bacterium]
FDSVDIYDGIGAEAEDQHVFTLYASHEAAQKKDYADKKRFLLYFSGSVRGLSPGAPVEFRGIKIGEVIDLKLEYNAKNRDFEIPVLIVIEPDRIYLKKGTHYNEQEKLIDFLVAKGLRAQLKSGNIVTGQQYVAMDFFPNVEPARIHQEGVYPVIPTLPTPIEEIGSKLNQLIAKLDRLPIDQIGLDLRDTVKGAKRIANSSELFDVIDALKHTIEELQKLAADVRLHTVPGANAALEQVRKSLNSTGSVLDLDSPLQMQLKETLTELSGAASSLRILMENLQNHPESILTGKGSEE